MAINAGCSKKCVAEWSCRLSKEDDDDDVDVDVATLPLRVMHMGLVVKSGKLAEDMTALSDPCVPKLSHDVIDVNENEFRTSSTLLLAVLVVAATTPPRFL